MCITKPKRTNQNKDHFDMDIIRVMSKLSLESSPDNQKTRPKQSNPSKNTCATDGLVSNRKQQQTTSNKRSLWLRLLLSGYVRKYLATRYINPADIAHVIGIFFGENLPWKFDYWYDYANIGSAIHGIENDGKILKCKHSDYYYDCYCFYSTFSFGMKPKSGKYKIKFKINQFDKAAFANIIGIISETSKNNKDKIIQNRHNLLWYWNYQLYDYIGWSVSDTITEEYLPNGLYYNNCSYSYEKHIFLPKKCIYCSNNKHYQNRLPGLTTNDVVVLEYDSNLSILSFSRENDNGKLNSYIKNLPKEVTFYWLVGHAYGEMSITVVD